MTMTTTITTDSDIHDYDEDNASPRIFIHAREFIPRLHAFCGSDGYPDEATLDYLKGVLDYYQNDSYLLEQHLQELSDNPIQAFKRAFAKESELKEHSSTTSSTSQSLQLYATYLYWLSKVVTPKVLIRYFPHSVADFSLLLSHITSFSTFHSYPWEARYILLLWLSLVINIPFSLDKFSDGNNTVYESLEKDVLKAWLGATGKERDAAALFGSKYFTRKDINEERLLSFLQWAEHSLVNGSDDAFLPVGIFQFLNHLLQDATRQSLTPQLRQSLYRLALLHDSEQNSNLAIMLKSPLLRRLRIKYIGRLAATYLPPATNISRRQIHMKSLFGQTDGIQEVTPDSDFDVPDEVDALLGGLMGSLSDSDSRVRWTASKAVSRIAAHVPPSFVIEIAEMVTALYRENVLNEGTDTEDLSLVSASAWQGATLCIASMLRQNLLGAEQVNNALPWIERALTFSQRKGAQKIGSSVRDAACYFCWCLSRAESVQGPLTSEEQAAKLGRILVVVACLDDETSVRRAASAAFQECAGRMSGILEGMDVLQLLDGQAVGPRRNAFLNVAPTIAKHHPFYRASITERLRNTLLYNQDIATRELAAESLARILEGHQEEIHGTIKTEIGKLATVKESRVAHGALLLLLKLCRQCQSPELKAEAFTALTSLPSSLCTGGPVALLLPTIAHLAQVCLVQAPQAIVDFDNLDHKNAWRRFLEIAQRRPESSSHEAAGLLINAVSSRYDCLNDLKRSLKSSSTPTSQQYVTAVLGWFDFRPPSPCNQLLGITIDRLTKVLNPSNTPTCKTIDAKCNALSSLGRMYMQNRDDPQTDTELIMKALFEGLEDYTTDQRGEVGSLVRNICLEQITNIALQQQQSSSPDPKLLHALLLQLLKQSVEKLDIVREQAGRQLERLSVVRKVVSEEELATWRQPSTTIRAVFKMFTTLKHPARLVLLSGLITSTGSPPEVQQPATQLFVDWAKRLSSCGQEQYNILQVLQEILELASDKKQSTRVTVPALHTLAALLEEDSLVTKLEGSSDGKKLLANIGAQAEKIAATSKVAVKQAAARRLHEATVRTVAQDTAL